MTVFELENLLSKFDPDDEVEFNEMLMSYEQEDEEEEEECFNISAEDLAEWTGKGWLYE